MELGIYSKDGRLKLSVAPGDNGACSCGIQEESILAVSFTAFECIALEVYDYADFEGRRYWILERYLPQMNARREWTYSIRMSGAEGLAGQTLMVNPEDDDNPVLTLSAPAREHAALIVANMNRRTGTTEWKVGEVVVSEYIDIEYTGKYASDALSELSAAAKTEWWFDGMTLNISRCEFGEPIPLSYGNGLIGGISRTTADGVKFFTRLFPVGSSRNIDPDYYGHARLQLPGGVKYVEQDTRLGIIEHYEQAAFEGIFPRRVGQVGTVRHEEAMGDDGESFTIWYFTDPDIPFDPNQYEIGGLVKRVTFQSGELRGREFEVNYDTEKKEFEIITQWPYDDDLQLPSEPLIPAPGDEYILWNIRMPESYYPAAEQEYKEAVDRFMADNRKDVSVWQAPTDFTVIERRALDLQPGQRIRLESAEAFPDTGFRETRIVSISRSVVRPGSMTLKMSDVLSTGRISRIESNIASVERLTKQVSSEFPDIIRSWEETLASDTTLYSSRKSEREFLNKRRGGTVEADVIFDKDITIGGSVVSKDFRQGDFSGSGFGAYRDRNGNAVLEADILKIRKEAIFNEAVINQVTFRVGATVFSNGGCEITRVEELETAFRCYYDNKEGKRYSGLTTGDQVRCQRYDPTQHTIIKYYWRLVTAVGEDYVELSKSDADGSASPEAGDEIAQFGNRSDITRQSAIVIDPLDGGSVEVYAHIDAYSLSEKNYVGMGVNPQTGEAYMYAYGDMFFGDRDLADSKSSWITYQKKEGEERRRLRIKADVTFGADSSGLGNLSEFKAQQQQIDDARKEAEEAKKEVGNIQFSAVNLIDGSERMVVPMGYGPNNFKAWPLGAVEAGERYAVSVESVELLTGDAVSGFDAQIWNSEDGTVTTEASNLLTLPVGGPYTGVFEITATSSQAMLVLYSGVKTQAAGRSVAYNRLALVRGNKPALSWSPSIADQEKYTDDKVDGIQIGSVNLLDGSREFTVTAGSGDNYKFQGFDIGEVEAGEVFALSVENISVLAGTPGELSVRMYNEGASKDLANYVEISAQERTALFTIKSDVTKQKAKVLFYAGKYAATAGNSVRYEGATLVRGNKPALSWSPSIADQEKYTDDKVDSIQIGGVNLMNGSELTVKPEEAYLNGNPTFEEFHGRVCMVGRNEWSGLYLSRNDFTDFGAGNWISVSADVFCEPADGKIALGNEYAPFAVGAENAGKWVRLSYSYQYNDRPVAIYNASKSGAIGFSRVKIEAGNKASAWSPSIADQEAAIDAAQQAADNAAAGVDSLKNFTDEAFADGIVDRAEAAAIEKYTNSVNETRKAADAAYAEIYGNPLLGGTAKSNLQAAKSAFDTAAADLLAAIATAADDGIASPGEQADVDAKYTLFNNAYGTFGTRLEEANKYMLTAVNTASQGALQLSQELQGVVNNINETILPDLQAQIDGSIVSWGGEEVPTLSNYPANQWTSDTERKRHIGDYYDRKTTVDGQAAYERYKFAFENNAYQWVRIADSGGAAAIATAREALGLAGTKARIFFGATTPAVPYSVNDVWFRSSGAGATLETTVYISNADKGQQETASAADWQLVDDSQVRLRQMSSDGVISREEKASLRNRLAQIQKAYTSYQNDAATYGVSIADLAAAYSALVNFLTGTVAVNNDTDTTLSAEQRSAYNAAFAAYDAEVSRFSNLVADAISQGKVDDIQFSAVNLIDGSERMVVPMGYGPNNFKAWPLGAVEAGERYAVSVESVELLTGDAVSGFDAQIWNSEDGTVTTEASNLLTLPVGGPYTGVFEITATSSQAMLVLYSGVKTQAAGRSVAYNRLALVRGNKPALSWSPSIADQEKYTDDKVDGIQIGSVNLLDGSREFTVTAGSGDNYKFQGFDIGEVEAGEVFALSVENISVLAGTPGELSVRMYNEGASKDLANYVEISAQERTALFTIKSDVTKQKAKVLFYAGKYAATAGNSVRYEGATLVRGNKPALSWSPSIADQEKYADQAVNGVETLIDASKLDQNTYYPVTIKLNGIARSKITVRVNLSDTQPGNPAWGTYNENRFSCQAVWYNNGNSWGSNYDKRIIEEYQHRYADGRPIGSVGQMTNSSNEYIYVRGGGVYRFFATNAGTPVLHTEAYTVYEQTVDLKTSVEPLVSLQEQANSTQQEAETTRQAIADMNDDTIFDVSEKQSIRTQWENISGYARTDVVLDSLSATNGSYYRVRDMAKAAGISTAGLLAAVNSLRVKLNDYALYTASNTPGFDRAGLAVLFTAYYAQEIDVLNAVSRKYTDGKVADIETSMKDYDYLKLVFPNNTVDNNGVFLSRLMAVKNGTSASAAVVAGLYGGGVDSLNNAGFKDPTHGILMMFAGATSIQNVAAAKTRIYGDGSQFTKALYADGGEIGGFKIYSDRIVAGDYDSGSDEMRLYKSLLRFRSPKTGSEVSIGTSVLPSSVGGVSCPMYVDNSDSSADDRIGIFVNVSGSVGMYSEYGNVGILIANGTFSGFRPMSRSYGNGTYTLHGNEKETVFFVNTSKGSTTFYLPSNPQPDQRYEIRKLHSGNSIIINAQNNGDIYVTGSNNPSSQISWTGRRCVTIQYSKNLDAWVMWFSYEA